MSVSDGLTVRLVVRLAVSEWTLGEGGRHIAVGEGEGDVIDILFGLDCLGVGGNAGGCRGDDGTEKRGEGGRGGIVERGRG